VTLDLSTISNGIEGARRERGFFERCGLIPPEPYGRASPRIARRITRTPVFRKTHFEPCRLEGLCTIFEILRPSEPGSPQQHQSLLRRQDIPHEMSLSPLSGIFCKFQSFGINILQAVRDKGQEKHV
jgi:hypothetical protein